jgi:hypothetical protein
LGHSHHHLCCTEAADIDVVAVGIRPLRLCADVAVAAVDIIHLLVITILDYIMLLLMLLMWIGKYGIEFLLVLRLVC